MTDNATGELDIIADTLKVPNELWDRAATPGLNPRFGAITIAASCPKERDLADNPVPIPGFSKPRNMIEAQMPTVWAEDKNRTHPAKSRLVKEVARYAARLV